ncbi:MAG TPA: molybdenum cofactor biosynthesis protein MoaE [Elusimicrobiota bacterium]|jgi:molybdopterin synthase catalytic subunit|nr:molybdenum cofactor biosynthesis protein MoaE [Elusimicrobiota bacterium]
MEILLTREPLSLDAACRAVRAPGRGGVVLFLGEVRPEEKGKAVSSIEYEAYESMARKELERLAAGAERAHGAAVAVHHRLGPVPAGETSVIVAAASAHRAEAFAACREVIDRLKESAPIWKASFAEAR